METVNTVIEIPGGITEMIHEAARGDDMAMGNLFEWFRPRLYAQALQLCGNTAAAQDAVQDTFINAFTHLYTLRDAKLFYPWLRRILLNNCYQFMRRKKVICLEDIPGHKDHLIDRSIDENTEKATNQQQLYQVLNCLSAELRSCVMLRYFSSFSTYEEIALLMGIPVGTVRSRLSAAREKLGKIYHRSEGSGDDLLKQSRQWSGYYELLWTNMYDDAEIRNELFNHLKPELSIRFTSGKMGKGRQIIEREVSEDIEHGTRFNAAEITSCGNMTIIEGLNSNTDEYPDRCPPSSVIVLFRENQHVNALHIFDSPRK